MTDPPPLPEPEHGPRLPCGATSTLGCLRKASVGACTAGLTPALAVLMLAGTFAQPPDCWVRREIARGLQGARRVR